MTYDGYPFVQAKHYRVGRVVDPTVVVVHTIEAAQTATTAAAVARYFATQSDANPTSAHAMADATQLIRMVRDEDTAYHCGTNGNRVGLGIEHAGRAGWSAAQWDTPYTRAMLKLSAGQIAKWCRKWHIPPVRISATDLRAGRPGICGHVDVRDAWPNDTSHWDPGSSWPWALHLQLIQEALAPPPVPVPTPDPEEDMLPPILTVNGGKTWLVAPYFTSKVQIPDLGTARFLESHGAVRSGLSDAQVALIPEV